MSGTQVERGLTGVREGKSWRMAMPRKNRFIGRENWSARLSGRKLSRVYLVEVVVLAGNAGGGEGRLAVTIRSGRVEES